MKKVVIDQIPESILERIDRVLDIEDCKRQATLIDQLVIDIQDLGGGEVAGKGAFLIGYLRYLDPRKNRRPELKDQLTSNLLLAVKTSKEASTIARAKLYLGHSTYDNGDFREAQKWFQKIELGNLTDYLALKAVEMRVCCTIRAAGLASSMEMIEEFVRKAESLPVEDIWPDRLAILLGEQIAELDQFTIRRFDLLAKRLDAVGNFGRWFSEISDRSIFVDSQARPK